MEVINLTDTEKMQGLDHPEPIRMVIPASSITYLRYYYKHFLASRPIRTGIQTIFLLFCIGWGIMVNHWTPLLIYLAVTLLVHAWLAYLIVKGYRYLLSDNSFFRIDDRGISLVFQSEGHFIRYETDPWSVVRQVYIYDDFCVMKMDEEAFLSAAYLLFNSDMKAARQSILGYWRLWSKEKDGTKRINAYSAVENEEAIEAIEKTFGPVAMFFNPVKSCHTKVRLAFIEASEERPYCTLCTIGAGAMHSEDVSQDMRLSGAEAEGVELMIYLPPTWKLIGEEWSNEENWWPARLLLTLVDEMHADKQRLHIGEWYDIDAEAEVSEQVLGVFCDVPSAHPEFMKGFNLSTGRAIDFMQAIPFEVDELEALEECEDYSEAMRILFNLDMSSLESMSDQRAHQVYTKHLIEHFEKKFGKTGA